LQVRSAAHLQQKQHKTVKTGILEDPIAVKEVSCRPVELQLARVCAFQFDTKFVYTYSVSVNITFSVDDELLSKAREVAMSRGTSVQELVREFLATVAGFKTGEEEARRFLEVSEEVKGDFRGWKFNREELHER
jgi:hypothetical protein